MSLLKKISILRPLHWIKNFLCFSGLIFGGRLFNLESILLSIELFIIFSLVSSSIYIFNDIKDKDIDRHHPIKKNRLIASGNLSIRSAYLIFTLILFLSLAYSYHLSINIFYITLLYTVNGILYTLFFKNIPVVDIIIIGFGFVLRLLSGIYLFNDHPTVWIILCTFFLAIFLGYGKRLGEYQNQILNKEKLVLKRPVLKNYSKDYLINLINDTSIITIISYSIFTVASGKNNNLVLTIPIVFFSISYYKNLIITNPFEEPEKIISSDIKIMLSIIIWLLLSVLILYTDVGMF